MSGRINIDLFNQLKDEHANDIPENDRSSYLEEIKAIADATYKLIKHYIKNGIIT